MKTILLLPFFALVLRAGEFPDPFNTQHRAPPMTAAETAATAEMPAGFRVSVFAAEPDIMNPLAMNWDTHGRMWVAENFTFSESLARGQANSFETKLRDRIVIFEGADDTGRFRGRKVFTDELQRVMSVAVGYGGVWVIAVPQLLFIPDRETDGVPDGPAQVALDGFNLTGLYHTVANGLRFGPDGWLYGRCGHSNYGEIGAPGTPPNERTPLRGSIWRYHPVRKTFEALSAGTVNPWGHDWDQHGEMFFVNTIIGHLWHQIPGAHYRRSTSRDPNPWSYELIDTHADHYHFETAAGWSKSKGAEADSFGGGHAAVGAMIYQGDNWPAEYRGGLYTLNLFGRRMNHEVVERRGSGYVARHGTDLFKVRDPWFRGLEVGYGPDGGVFILDWSDTGEYTNRDGVHRRSGRIYKVSYGAARRSPGSDLSKLAAEQLVALHTHANEWFARHARQELLLRSLHGREMGSARDQLRSLYNKQDSAALKLRALWTLYALGGTDEGFLRTQLRAPNEHIRAWAIRLLTDTWPLDTVMSARPAASVAGAETNPDPSLLNEFTRMAAEDSSGLVRLVLSSTLQRLPVSQRVPLASALGARKEDANDHNLPLMIWYALIPVATDQPAVLPKLAAKTELPTTRKYIARRLAEDIEKNSNPLNELIALAAAKPEAFQADIVDGVSQALKGFAKATKPVAWDALAKMAAQSSDAGLRDRVRNLNVIFGSAGALEAARKMAFDPDASMEARKSALQSIVDHRPADLRQLCERLIQVPGVNAIAARALATFDDPAIGPMLIAAYPRFEPSDRPQLIAVLASRAAFARSLLDAVAIGKIPRSDISAFDARQIRNLDDPALNQRLAGVWGEVRETSAAKKQLAAKYKAQLTPAVLARADKREGRLVFNTICAACHTLYGEGGKIGPDLTGGNRHSLDYLLAKVVDPNAQILPDFRYSIAKLKDGRLLTGVVTTQTDRTTTMKTMTGPVTIAQNEIQSIEQSPLSLMPEGLFETLTIDQVRDLVAYLMGTAQVSLPER